MKSKKDNESASKKNLDEAVLIVKNLYAENLILKAMLHQKDSSLSQRFPILKPTILINVCDTTSPFYNKALCILQNNLSAGRTPVVGDNCLDKIHRGGRNEDELNGILQECSGN